MQTLPTELLMKVFRAKWEPAGEAQPSAVELTLLVRASPRQNQQQAQAEGSQMRTNTSSV